jgi:hypothetical protein
VGRSISASPPSLTIFPDVSLSGWGAVSYDVKTGGPWTIADTKRHINELEILAAFNGLKCFASSAHRTTVEINIDNTTAVAYINKKGETKSSSLCSVALEISTWCEEREIDLHAVHLPGKSNFVADAESRKQLSTGDWKLSTTLFQKIQQLWNMRVDLFASSWNTQLPIFVSWFPPPGRGRQFTLNWRYVKSFMFPLST